MTTLHRCAIVVIALASFSTVLLSETQEESSRSEEQKFVVALEALKVVPDAKEYSDRMTENIDSICAAHAALMQRMTLDELLAMLNGKMLSDDAKFLLITSWIRVHPEADHDTFKALAAGRGKSFYSQFVGIHFEEGMAMSSGLRFDAIGFPNATSGFHGLFFAWKVEDQGGGVFKDVTDGLNRSRSFWYIKVNERPTSKSYSLRRIERSWPVAKLRSKD